MSVQKIDNTFARSMEQINRLEKVFREGGLLEKAVMDINGDIAWLKDIREALSDAYESMEDGHIGCVGHMNPDESAEEVTENKYGGRLGFRDMEALGDKAASEIDMQARRMGSADMEPGDADELRYKIAVDMGYIEESAKPITEGVLDSDDDDGFMARSQLYFLARDAIQLHGMIDDRDNLAGWVQSKIAKSSEAIEAVRRYTEYNAQKVADEVMPDDIASEDKTTEGFSILPSIDRERYQERDGLEGPFQTKSGKVVYYDPKEGRYYDPDTDMYLSHEEWEALDEEFLNEFLPAIGAALATGARMAAPAAGRLLGRLFGRGKTPGTSLAKPKPKAPAPKPKSTMSRTSKSRGASGGRGRKQWMAGGGGDDSSDGGTGFVDGYRTGSAISSSAEPKGTMIPEVSADPAIVAKFAKVSPSQRSYYVMKWAEENGISTDDAMVMAGYEKGDYMGAGAYNWRYVGESVNEAEEKNYVCVHAKKGKHECKATSSYGAAKKAAEHWGMKSTAGIDAHLADKEKTATESVKTNERKMTGNEKTKEKKLKKKYDDSGMKKDMKDRYGDEEGMKVYYATLRKKAMTKGAK